MYETFFALKEKPFSLAPNPRFLFLSKTHNEVYAHLIYGIESRAGFIEVTGEVGTGKTTVLRTLLAQLDEDKYRLAFIFNPKLTAFELLRNINREFGIADDGLNSPDLIHALNDFLLTENRAGRTPILIIDEAQNLSGDVLEQIRLLSNLETENDKLIQIVLVGQPELRNHLSDYSLRQLNQRIAVRYQLRPLNHDETAEYILHRLKLAGRPDGNIFSRAALRRVFQCSGGVPRRINLICDRALLTAFSEERGVVSPRDVNQAVAELAGMGEGQRNMRQTPRNLIAATVMLLLFLLAGFYWLDPFGHAPLETSLAPAAVTPVAPVAGTRLSPPEKSLLIDTSQQSNPITVPLELLQPNSLLASCNAIFTLWDAPLLSNEASSAGFDLEREFGIRGFELIRMAGRFEDFSKFNVPLLLPLPEEQGGGYLAVLGQTVPGKWAITPAYQGHETMSLSELNDLGINMAFVPWIDFAAIGYVAAPDVKGENVRRLQFLLGLTGCIKIKTNGRYDASSINCVKDFQRTHDLVVDGLVGPRTLIMLYQAAGAYKMPRLS